MKPTGQLGKKKLYQGTTNKHDGGKKCICKQWLLKRMPYKIRYHNQVKKKFQD